MVRSETSRRLREARELASIGQGDAARAVGLSRTAVTQIEAGNRAISTLELAQLADLYGRPVDWFLPGAGDSEDDLAATLRRWAPGLDAAPESRTEVDRCIQLFRDGMALERMLGRDARDGPPAYREPAPKSIGEAVAQGEWVAEQERRRLRLGSAPIANLTELLGDRGIWTAVVPLPDTMSGLSIHHRSIGVAVLANAAHGRARQRFSLAHEYAHALIDRDRTVSVSSADNSGERIEQRANAFAAALLLPEDGLEEELRQLGKGQPARTDHIVFDAATGGSVEGKLRPAPHSQTIGFQDIAAIAHKFGTSYRATVYRLKSLRLINQPECALLLSPAQEQAAAAYLQTLGLLDDLESPVPAEVGSRELRSRVIHLALEAYRRDEISRGRLVDLGKAAGIAGSDLLELAEAMRTG